MCVHLPVKNLGLKGGFGGGRGLLVGHGGVSLGWRVLNSLLASRAGESARYTLGHSVGHLSQNSFSSFSLGPSPVSNRAFLLCALSAKLRPLSRFTSFQGGSQYASRALRRWRQTPPSPLFLTSSSLFLLIL